MAKHLAPSRTSLAYGLQFIGITVGSFLIAGWFLNNPSWRLPLPSSSQPLQCRGSIQPNNDLSRDQLTQLSQAESSMTQAELQALLGQPYCQVASLELPGGEKAVGEVYPLAFDPQTWLVVLYRDEAFVGYQFEFR
jgi:hypothetical protein